MKPSPKRTARRPLTLLAGLLAVLVPWIAPPALNAADDAYDQRSDVQVFIRDVSARHGLDAEQVSRLFASARRQDSILEAIARPAEGKPWYEYRKIFLTPARIRGGVSFWDANREDLERAQRQYGVPPEIVVAIIGVETFYGQRTGRHRVFDSLVTLGFDYPPRAKFFRGELEQLLLLGREEDLDLGTIKGSYAGAMGIGQFIPSSYRAYAVDFNGDGRRDLWNTQDAIGSVANYFKRHGWATGGRVATPAQTAGEGYRKLVGKGIKPSLTRVALQRHGVSAGGDVLDGETVALLEYDRSGAQKEYWLGFQNFYVITRYNHSPLYGMAVYQLGEAIKQAREN